MNMVVFLTKQQPQTRDMNLDVNELTMNLVVGLQMCLVVLFVCLRFLFCLLALLHSGLRATVQLGQEEALLLRFLNFLFHHS